VPLTPIRQDAQVARVELTVTIARPAADVFHVVSTPELAMRWSSNAIEEHITTSGPLGVGSRRRATVRGFGGGTTQNEIEVTDYEPGRRLSVRSIEAPVPFTSEWTVTPVDSGTRVDWRWDFRPRGWQRPFGPLVGFVFRRTFEPDLARLKSMMEAGEL
jgi:uncharacterized protein YndB with AHSA1/START domain